MKNRPKYVKLNDIALRYRPSSDDYWCDNGEWGVDVSTGCDSYINPNTFEEYTEIYSIGETNSINGVRLIPCTEAEWVKSVGYYFPSGYKLEGEFAPKKGVAERYIASRATGLDENGDVLGGEDDWSGELIDKCFIEALKDSQKNYKYLLIRR